MSQALSTDDVTIEGAMIKCAALVDRYGDCMLPMLERLEREYEARKATVSAVERIRAMLAKHKVEAGHGPD